MGGSNVYTPLATPSVDWAHLNSALFDVLVFKGMFRKNKPF